MSTTTIRIDDALRARIATAAERAGKSQHALILEALTEAMERVEVDEELHRIADERWASLVQTGKSVPLTEAQAYLQARAAGRAPAKPTARKLVR